MFPRQLQLPKKPQDSFFLWGPRKTGKSSLMQVTYPKTPVIDLLETDQVTQYMRNPSLLREHCLGLKEKGYHFVIIDEIQKVPQLLDEVHLLIEKHKMVFGLCGSSVRKLKRGASNLLGGRALKYELRGMIAKELGSTFDLIEVLNRGYLPSHIEHKAYKNLHDSYINQYLKEEIAAEGLVRNLSRFSDFLSAACFSDAECVNYTNIASDCGVSSQTVREYFSILEETLIGNFVPAYTHKLKRRVTKAPKFYFFDVAIPNHLLRRSNIIPKTEIFGKAFENWVFHELESYQNYQEKFSEISYWRLIDTGHEVDFIINDCEVAIEVKGSSQITKNHLKGLRQCQEEFKTIKHCLVVCLEKKMRKTEDGILILPYKDFLEGLWQQRWF